MNYIEDYTVATNTINYNNQFNVQTIESEISLDGSNVNFNNETSPLSFKEWLSKRIGIENGNEYYQYNRYLQSWYSEKSQQKEVQLNSLKNDYISLLNQISLIFKDDDNLKFVNEVDFDSNLDLEHAIPYYTKKLKEIAYYISVKRESSKNAKLKYNMVGSNQAIEKLFYQYLLQAFTKKNTVVEVQEFSALSLLPSLSSTNTKFTISVEEIYDNNSYFDKDPSKFNNFTLKEQQAISNTRQNYFDSLDYESSSSDWIFESGYMPLCANNPLLWTLESLLNSYGVTNTSKLPFSAVDLSQFDNPQPNEYNLFYLNQKYLGNDMYILSGGYYILNTLPINISLNKGNTWFYWPTGEFITDNYNVASYNPIALSSTNLIDNGAVASEDYRNADKIFVERENEIKAAWLRNITNSTQTSTMSCVIAGNSDLTFKFPYCNFGFIGDGNTWSGRGFNNINSEYYYLDEDQKRKTDLAYWEKTDNTSINNIEINDTNLSYIDNINASLYYENADKIIIRKATGTNKIYDSNKNASYIDGFEYAWLYKFEKTDLPVKVGRNNYVWPLQRLDDVTASTIKVSSNFTTPIALSTLPVSNFIGARAGYGLADSDIIYKLNSKGGYPIEAAFLKGFLIRDSLPSNIKVIDSNYSTYISNVTGIMQIGLTHKCKPNAPENFIWQDPDTNISDLDLTYKPHQDDCPFALYSKHPSIYGQKDSQEFSFIFPWTECTCKSVVYSPIGHTGSNYSDFNGMADIIVQDTQYPNTFNLNTWVGSDGLPYDKSSDFAWYQIKKPVNIQNNQYGLDVDVGMGVGSWVTGSGQEFKFKTGKQYKYIRNSMGRTNTEVDSALIPYYIISKLYKNSYKPIWTKAVYDATLQTWVETQIESDMIINSGEYILYDHFESNFYCLLFDGSFKSYEVITYPVIKQNTDSNPWVNFNYVTTGVSIIYKWPDKILDSPRNPLLLASQLSSVTWSVESDVTNSYLVNYFSDESLTIISNTPGTFIINATGYSSEGIDIVKSSKIGVATCISPKPTINIQTSGSYDIRTIYADSINFIWNSPLLKSRPFWGQAVDDNSYITKFKGVKEWGYGLRVADDYTFIHQPPASRLTLSAESVITYVNKGSTFTWIEPITINSTENKKVWSKLNYNGKKISPLSSYLNNANLELVVYPTNEESDLIIKPYDYINYYAINNLTWTEVLTNTIDGVPPYGGTFVPYYSSLAIESLVSYANLTNRHYPTLAVYPDVYNFYTERDSGGYFLPHMLGTNVYLGKNYKNIINPQLANNTLVGKQILFRDPNVFVSNDVGNTGLRQNGPIVNDSFNATWMKASPTEGNRAGEIKNAIDYKEFIPYQTKEETLKQDINSIISRKTDLDPWYGEFDDVWRDNTNWPSTFKKEYRITDWYNNNKFFIKQIDNNIYNQTLTFDNTILCNTSKFIINKTLSATECRGCGNTVSAFNTTLLSLGSITQQDAGNLILDINSSKLNNIHVPILSSSDIDGKSFDSTKMIYGEETTSITSGSVQSIGYLRLLVNSIYYYIPVNIGRSTKNCVTNLQGTIYTTGTFTPAYYIKLKMNDKTSFYLKLYTRA